MPNINPTLTQADQARARAGTRKKGYVPTAQRRVLFPDQRKGSEKRWDFLKEENAGR